MMLSGDQEDVAQKVSEQLGLDDYRAGLLPDEKVAALEDLLKEEKRGKVAFVDDRYLRTPAGQRGSGNGSVDACADHEAVLDLGAGFRNTVLSLCIHKSAFV